MTSIDAGADNYLTKPFHVEEILARLRPLICRAHGQVYPVLQCGALSSQPVALTSHKPKLQEHSSEIVHWAWMRW